MAANDVILSRYPMSGDGVISVLNTDGTNALTPGMLVTLDGSNLLSTTQPIIGVKMAVADNKIFGVCLEAIGLNKIGRVQTPYRGIVPAFAGTANSGVITAGDSVEGDASGACKTSAGSKFVIGDALQTTAAAGDQLLLAVPAQAKV